MKIEAVGIDFGTTNSVICHYKDPKQLNFIPINNKIIVPTIINYRHGLKFGISIDDADILSIKRKIGSNELIENKHVADICCDIFEQIKYGIENYMQGASYKAIVTVPAYFNDIQRNIIKLAALTAGIDVLMILNEPTSAILSNKRLKEGCYLVYDFGGGTFDVSVVLYKEGIFQILGTSGNTELGGDDIDEAISRQFNLSIKDARTLKESGKRNKDIIRIYKEFADKTISICKELLLSLNTKLPKIDHIIMVGGSSKIKTIQNALKEVFGITPTCKNPDTSVAEGAAIKAYHIINKTNHILIDVAPLTLGIEVYGGGVDPIIRRNSRIPCTKSETYTDVNDKQRYLKINIVQGESRIAKKCTRIGQIKLPIKRSNNVFKPRFLIEFKINIEGILKVKATQIGENITEELVINPNYGLTKGRVIENIKALYEDPSQSINKMLENDLMKNAQEAVAVVEKALSEDIELLSKEELEKIQAKIAQIKNSTNSSDKLLLLCHELEEVTNDFAERRIRKILNLNIKKPNLD